MIKLHNGDFEKALFKQEALEGEFETPTVHLPVKKITANAEITKQELKQIKGQVYGPVDKINGIVNVKGNIEAYANPAMIGMIFSSFFGNPVTTDSGTHIHSFNPYAEQSEPKAYTLESSNSGLRTKLSGLKCNTFAIAVEEAGFSITSEFFGRKFLNGNTIVTVGGPMHACYFAETVSYQVGDSVDLFSGTDLAAAGVVIESISPDKHTLVFTGFIPTPGMTITPTAVATTMIDQRPFQFYTNTNISLEGTELNVKGLTLDGTNNIDTKEGFFSGSNTAQAVNGKQRYFKGTFIITGQDRVKFLGSYNAPNSTLTTSIVLTSDEGNTLTFEGEIIIDSVTNEVATGTTNVSNVNFGFKQLTKVELRDSLNATYTF